MKEDLFAEFPFTSAQEWRARITQDLKGKLPDDLLWSPDGTLHVDPFVHAEDVPEPLPSLTHFGSWLIGETFEVRDVEASHEQMLTALQGGTESLHIICPHDISWATLLKDIKLPLIHLGVEIRGDIRDGLQSLGTYVREKYASDALRINVYLAGGSDPEVLTSLINDRPYIRICVKEPAHEEIAHGLAAFLLDGYAMCGRDAALLQHVDLSMTIGMHYLVEIARLRAVRILWQRLAEQLGFEIAPAFAIEAKTHARDDDPYSHMIRNTIMGTASVLGGADRISIQPSTGGGHPEAFHRRIARNIHHLLRYESKLPEITEDPLAGAYYLEKLTREIVDRVWGIVMDKMG